jgi:hypothetical protein
MAWCKQGKIVDTGDAQWHHDFMMNFKKSVCAVVVGLVAAGAGVPAAHAGVKQDARAVARVTAQMDRALKANAAAEREAVEAHIEELRSCEGVVGTLPSTETEATVVMAVFGPLIQPAYRAQRNVIMTSTAKMASLKLNDRALRTWTKRTAAMYRWIVQQPQVDVCAMLTAWKDTGFSSESSASVLDPGLEMISQMVKRGPTAAHDAAAKRSFRKAKVKLPTLLAPDTDQAESLSSSDLLEESFTVLGLSLDSAG